MLKILLVDNDALSKKALRVLIPWESHDMKIVGDVSNGQEALDFLEHHVVDLTLVALDMPVMDGLTFLKLARAHYPRVNHVVLTIRDDFESIQSCLRLGVIDYISKLHFDQEDYEQILERIRARIAPKDPIYAPPAKWWEQQLTIPHIYALITIDEDNDEQIFQFWELNQLNDQSNIIPLAPGVWIFPEKALIQNGASDPASFAASEQSPQPKEFLFPETFTNTELLKITDLNGVTFQQLGKALRHYIKELFFYDYQPVRQVRCKPFSELSEEDYILDENTLNRLKSDWLSLNWVQHNKLFDQLKFDLKNSKLKSSQLYHLLLALESLWNTSYSSLTGSSLELPSTFHHWHEVEEWLMMVYEQTNLLGSSSSCSCNVTHNIMTAKSYVDSHYAEQIIATEVARMVYMSYGYFSRCFHDIIGMSFSDYCTRVRIENAQNYLQNSNESIQQIAYRIGYRDEKYFSRIFKKSTGMTPSEYRKKGPQL